MPIIYCDNFRGFKKAFIELKNVNFLVGENSTGKTSILKLVALISSQGFWRYGEFSNDDLGLSSFVDMVTTPITAQGYIEIGLTELNKTADFGQFCLRVKFIEQDKLASLKEVCFINSEFNLQGIIEGNILKYRFNKFNSNKPFSFVAFKKWITNNGLNKISFSKMSLQYRGVTPILSQIMDIIKVTPTKNLPLPGFAKNFAWIAPVRAEPRRTYRNEPLKYKSEGGHSPSLLREISVPDVKKY